MAETENKVSLKDKKRLVKALFSYTPVNIDELQLKVNDVLEVIEETEEGWWKGILNGNVGMFPSNFVIELDNVPEELKNHSVNELSPTKIVSKAKNIDLQDSGFKHDLTHPPSTKLDIKSNMSSNSEDVTDSTKNADSLDRKSSLTKKNVDSTAPRLPPKPVREQARVIYPYTALNEDELSLKEGDIITVISKEVEDKGWWKGELNNKTGVFPDNFVQLIKVEEQKKPERPDKPSTALTSKAGLKSSSDKSAPDFSPKVEKKVIKTPPVKPPPPDIHRKEPERPSPPFPCKKPQVPHPMKKPSRSSLGAKFSGFSPPTPVSTSKPPAPETVPAPVSASPPVLPPTSDTKLDILKIADKFNKEDKKEKEDKSKMADKFSKEDKKEKEDKLKTTDKFSKDDKKEKEDKKDKETKKDKDVKDNPDLGFEGLESSGKKLIHLTANRVSKVPNRRPPSHIFLRETEKENGISSDPRRLSEPLLSEMKSILPLGDIELPKANAFAVNEVKAKVPPSRPLPPSIKANKPVVQGSVILTKTISSEECIVKAPEPIKKPLLPDTSSIPGLDPKMHIKRVDIPSDFKPPSSDKELQELKENVKILMATMVNRNEFNELAKQVIELKENLEKCNSNFKKTINELKTELEAEKKMRLALEIELQQMKERQTT